MQRLQNIDWQPYSFRVMRGIAVASLEPKKFMGDDGIIIRLYDDLIACGDEQHKLDGIQASVEDGSALESRVTLTRMLVVGLLAFVFKRKAEERNI